MRRSAEGLVGTGWRSWLLDKVIIWMTRHAPFHMVSDTKAAMKYWRDCTGVDGGIVSIPVRQPQAFIERKPGDAITIGLLGGFRIEKGAAIYEDILKWSFSLKQDIIFDCQITQTFYDPREQVLAQSLQTNWGNHRQVRLHIGHLDKNAYTHLLYSADIVLIPYDAATYGPGSSGVMFEAVAAGRIVAVTRIAWAVEEYANHPNIVWLEGLDQTAVMNGLQQAIAMVVERRLKGRTEEIEADCFQATWLKALETISTSM